MSDLTGKPAPASAHPIGAVLFDLDGTLIDSRQDITNSVNHLRESHGLEPISVEEVAGMVGLGIRVLLDRALGDDRTFSIDEAVRRFRSHYREHCLDHTFLYPGVEETLDRLSDLRLAIVSNKPEEFSRKIVDGLGVGDRFITVIGGDSTPEKKPHPEPLLRALRDLGSTPLEAMIVGDSDVDVDAGRRAGVRTCAVTYGLGARQLLDEARPQHRIDRFSDLLDVIASIRPPASR